jgi:hypothetical protein
MKTLWATQIGAEDWQEELITEVEEDIEKASAWAIENGFDRLRIADIDLTVIPDFAATIA